MAKGGFTDVFLKSLRPKERRYTVYERDPRYEGFAVEVLTSGRLSFRYRYRLLGKREKVTIGSYPKISLSMARERYREMVGAVQRGISPAKEKRRQREGSGTRGRTFQDLASDWVVNVLRRVNKNPLLDERYLSNDILPLLATRELRSIGRPDLWACIDVVRGRGRLQAARRVQSILKRVLDYGLSRGELEKNPAHGIDPRHVAPARSRSRILSPQEIPVWLHAIETSSISRPIKLALRLLLLLPVRKGELLDAKWADVDLANRTWDIPKENSKNGTPIRHRLSEQVAAIFSELHIVAAGSQWVLPSPRGHGHNPMSKSTLNKALTGVGGLPNNVVIHDLRRTIRTNLAELGVPSPVAELCLNHRPSGITQVYDRSEMLDQRYEALLSWERRLQGILAPEAAKQPAVPGDVRILLEKVKADKALRDIVLARLLEA